ncbi:uncharacterized protein LOC144094986 [Amblyomma americanum]
MGGSADQSTFSKEDFADVLRRADEEMQWLIGITLAALAGAAVAAVFLVSWAYACFEICRDVRQSVLILWDTMLFRDPCYRVLRSLADNAGIWVPDYGSYLWWKPAKANGTSTGSASVELEQSSSVSQALEEDSDNDSLALIQLPAAKVKVHD